MTRTDKGRLVAACEGAFRRFVAVEAEGIDPDVFEELGTVLFWLCTTSEAIGMRPQEPKLLLGLRWARDKVTHGQLVTAPVDWQYGAELGRLVLDKSRLDMRSHHQFRPRDETISSRKADKPKQAAYDQEVANRPVAEVLQRAIDLLR